MAYQETKSFSRHSADGKTDLGGIFDAPGLKIHWAGSRNAFGADYSQNVRPVDVINATIDRLQAEQKTDLGSDANARALVYIMKAKAELTGEVVEMPDGTPVIQ